MLCSAGRFLFSGHSQLRAQQLHISIKAAGFIWGLSFIEVTLSCLTFNMVDWRPASLSWFAKATQCYAPVSLGASRLRYAPVVHNICNYSLLPLGREPRRNCMLRPCFSKAIVKKYIYIYIFCSFSRVLVN